MKTASDTLGVARSNFVERLKGSRARRGPQVRAGDLELAAEIRRLVDARPTHGYRRWRRSWSDNGRLEVRSTMSVYRLMKKHGLPLARHTGQRRQHPHDGKVVTLHSNVRLSGLLTAVLAGIGSSGSCQMMVLGCPEIHLLEKRDRPGSPLP